MIWLSNWTESNLVQRFFGPELEDKHRDKSEFMECNRTTRVQFMNVHVWNGSLVQYKPNAKNRQTFWKFHCPLIYNAHFSHLISIQFVLRYPCKIRKLYSWIITSRLFWLWIITMKLIPNSKCSVNEQNGLFFQEREMEKESDWRNILEIIDNIVLYRDIDVNGAMSNDVQFGYWCQKMGGKLYISFINRM